VPCAYPATAGPAASASRRSPARATSPARRCPAPAAASTAGRGAPQPAAVSGRLGSTCCGLARHA